MKAALAEERAHLQEWSKYDPQFGTYGSCKNIEWDYEQERPYKGDVLREKRRAYLLLFYNPEKAAKEQVERMQYWTKLASELESGKMQDRHGKNYTKYFNVTQTPNEDER